MAWTRTIFADRLKLSSALAIDRQVVPDMPPRPKQRLAKSKQTETEREKQCCRSLFPGLCKFVPTPSRVYDMQNSRPDTVRLNGQQPKAKRVKPASSLLSCSSKSPSRRRRSNLTSATGFYTDNGSTKVVAVAAASTTQASLLATATDITVLLLLRQYTTAATARKGTFACSSLSDRRGAALRGG